MASDPNLMDPFDEVMAEIPCCALTEQGVREQRARYAGLAPSVDSARREADAVTVEFNERLDQDLLDQTLAVERECCPFFLFQQTGRRLLITVREPEQTPALDAIAGSLGAVN